MLRAIALARRAEGLTRPNPPVGAVLVKHGRVVGEGYHRRAGGPHAEVFAFRKAGAKARGATLYVTLEPCSTWGRTPPCVEAIMKHGVKRVVVGVRDPNPRHAGRGLDILRQAGIEVVTGVEAGACQALLDPFASWMTRKRPWVTLKMGVSLDGRIADASGRSRWITGPEARREVHSLRRRVDAILVGRRTVAADNPSLLPAPAYGRKPLRVVLDPRGRLSLKTRVLSDGLFRQTLVFTGASERSAYVKTLRARGIDVERVPLRRGVFSLARVMQALATKNILHVLCEGGGALAASLIREELVDEAWWFIAPRVLGGTGSASVAGSGWPLAEAPAWRVVDCQRLGSDVWIRARPGRSTCSPASSSR